MLMPIFAHAASSTDDYLCNFSDELCVRECIKEVKHPKFYRECVVRPPIFGSTSSIVESCLTLSQATYRQSAYYRFLKYCKGE